MNRYTSLFETPLVSLAQFDHPRHEPHEDPPEERSDGFAVNFVLRGSYRLRTGKQSWRMTPDRVFVTRPGLDYSCRHEEEHPTDVCLCVGYKGDPSAFAEPRSGNAAPVVVLLTNRLAFLRFGLERLLEAPPGRLAAEDTAAELWRSVSAPEPRHRRLYRSPQLRWYAERIHASKEAMSRACEEDHSLDSLARDVGMSPFHFARIFRELCGLPPRQYLLKVRLEHACSMLEEGASVTEACLASGFNSISYFSRFFRRRFGVPPSRFADRNC